MREGYGVGLWKGIRKEGYLMLKKTVFIFYFLFFVGDGRRVRFWKDKWSKNNTLCDSFSSLYALADSTKVWVADCWDSLGVEGG